MGSALKILVLRGGALGDLILIFPALNALRARFANASIRLLGVFPHAKLAAPKFVNEVESLDAQALVPLFSSGEQLDRLRSKFEGYDLAVSYLSDPAKRVEKNLLALGIRQVLAGPHKPVEKVGSSHAAIQFVAALEVLGARWQEPDPMLDAGPFEQGRIAVHIGSGSPAKNWPLDRWLKFLRVLEPDINDLFIIAGEADKDRLIKFRNSFQSAKAHIVENRPIRELADLLATCEFFVGHDSGISHLAAAAGTPTIALFGPTNPQIWAPRGKHVSIVRSDDHRMESISVEQVLAGIVLKS